MNQNYDSMKKVIKFIVFILLVALVVITFSACMVTRRIMPDGLQSAIEGFEILPVEIQSVNYVPSMNTLRISLIINSDNITREYVAELVDMITAYLRTQQFSQFMKNVQEVDDGFFSVALSVLNAEGEWIHRIEALARNNFDNWGNGFGEVHQLLAPTVGCVTKSYSVAFMGVANTFLEVYYMTGNTIVILADDPLTDFRFIDVLIDECEQEGAMTYLYAGETLSTVEVLLPSRLYVLHDAFATDANLSRAITFLGQHDMQRYFLLSFCDCHNSIALTHFTFDRR